MMEGELLAPLDRVTVIEIANWVAAPSAGALLSDLGARVIKVEPPGGDAMRYMARQPDVTGSRAEVNYAFQQDNRGKESIALDLDRSEGREVALRLCAQADVLLTNMTPDRQARFRMTPQDLWASNGHLIYAALTSYGLRGPEANRGAFDNAAFFARSGISMLSGERDSPMLRFRTGLGDHTTALGIVAAILAALRLRDRTDRGYLVDVSLFGTAIWTLGQDFSAALVDGKQPQRFDSQNPANPIANAYACADGKYIVMTMGQSDRYWPRFCRAIGRSDLAEDPRYATAEVRSQNSRDLTGLIASVFATKDRDIWAHALNTEGLLWAPAFELPEVCRDEQARAIGIFASVEHPVAGEFETIASPFRIEGADIAVRGPAPEYGANTWDVLLELGYTEDAIAGLAANAVLG